MEVPTKFGPKVRIISYQLTGDGSILPAINGVHKTRETIEDGRANVLKQNCLTLMGR